MVQRWEKRFREILAKIPRQMYLNWTILKIYKDNKIGLNIEHIAFNENVTLQRWICQG